MRKIIFAAAICGIAVSVFAAPAPYPVTVNSRSARAPDLLAFAGNRMVYRVTFKDGSTASNIGSETPFLHWAVSATSTTFTAASASVVDSTNGIVDFTFVPANLNYAAGTYIYEVGIKTGADVPKMYRQGTFALRGSPTGTGVGTNFPSTINWATYDYQATATHGPVRATGTGQTTSTNADGSITINIPAGSISTLLPGTAIDITTNGTTYTISVDGTEPFNASGATNLSASELRSGTVPNARLDPQLQEWAQVSTGTYVRPKGFSATMTTDQNNIADSTWTTVAFDSLFRDTDSSYNTNTYTYTFPATGLWIVAVNTMWTDMDEAKTGVLRFQTVISGVTNNINTDQKWMSGFANNMGLTATIILDVETTSDTVKCQMLHANGDATPDIDSDQNPRFGAVLSVGK